MPLYYTNQQLLEEVWSHGWEHSSEDWWGRERTALWSPIIFKLVQSWGALVLTEGVLNKMGAYPNFTFTNPCFLSNSTLHHHWDLQSILLLSFFQTKTFSQKIIGKFTCMVRVDELLSSGTVCIWSLKTKVRVSVISSTGEMDKR
jgi:hypothetical protein